MGDCPQVARTAPRPRGPTFPLPRLPASPPPSQPLIPACHRHRYLRWTLSRKRDRVRRNELAVLGDPAEMLNVNRLRVDLHQVEHRGSAAPYPGAVGTRGADRERPLDLSRPLLMVMARED